MSQFVKDTVEINGEMVPVLKGIATLKSKPGTKLVKDKYHLGTIEYTMPSGQKTESLAIVWAKTMARMEEAQREWEVGKEYLCQLSVAENENGKRLFATLSHLVGFTENEEAKAEAFEMLNADVEAPVEAPAV